MRMKTKSFLLALLGGMQLWHAQFTHAFVVPTTRTTSSSPFASRASVSRTELRYGTKELLHGKNKKLHVTVAGSIWPIIQKFRMGPAKFKEIVQNVAAITDWKDVLFLSIGAFAATPAAKFYYNQLGREDEEKDETNKGLTTAMGKTAKRQMNEMKRFGVIAIVDQVCKLSLSVYAVDVLSIMLTTLGFQFPHKWRISDVYAKVACT